MNILFKLTVTLTIIISLFLYSEAKGQCGRGAVNCIHGCGRFIDNDGDGFCDLGLKLIPDTVKSKTNDQKDSIKKDVLKSSNTQKATIHVPVSRKKIREPIFSRQIGGLSVVEKAQSVKPRYALLFYSILTIGLYFISFMLLQFSVISKRTHRKIWNIILLVTFLLSCILGFIVVLQINYGFFPDYFLSFLKWHVEFGIGMTLIAIFHIFWHLKYFRNIMKTAASVEKKQ